MRPTLTLPALTAFALAACAQDATLPPIEDETFPVPEQARDWEDWGEDRPDAPPGGRQAAVIGQMLDGADIRRALSGQTLRGCYPNGTRFVERLDEDGRFYLIGDAEEYQGRWSVEDDRLCFDYEVGPNADQPESCFPVSRQAGELYFYASDMSAIVAATVCPSNQG